MKDIVDKIFDQVMDEDCDDPVYRFAELLLEHEHKAMMQLFTDPENQPTQHDTVTIEYMQREVESAIEKERKEAAEHYLGLIRDCVAKERDACAKLCESPIATQYGKALANAIRARGDKHE